MNINKKKAIMKKALSHTGKGGDSNDKRKEVDGGEVAGQYLAIDNPTKSIANLDRGTNNGKGGPGGKDGKGCGKGGPGDNPFLPQNYGPAMQAASNKAINTNTSGIGWGGEKPAGPLQRMSQIGQGVSKALSPSRFSPVLKGAEAGAKAVAGLGAKMAAKGVLKQAIKKASPSRLKLNATPMQKVQKRGSTNSPIKGASSTNGAPSGN